MAHGNLRLCILVDVSLSVHVLVVVHGFITDEENYNTLQLKEVLTTF